MSLSASPTTLPIILQLTSARKNRSARSPRIQPARQRRRRARRTAAARQFSNERGLSTRHAQDLLSAFRQDATKHRYANWDELIDYCSRSAMPVGRFVLDVHGEAQRHLARLGCAVRGIAGHQPPAGLREGLSGARPGLYSARCVVGQRRQQLKHLRTIGRARPCGIVCAGW